MLQVTNWRRAEYLSLVAGLVAMSYKLPGQLCTSQKLDEFCEGTGSRKLKALDGNLHLQDYETGQWEKLGQLSFLVGNPTHWADL